MSEVSMTDNNTVDERPVVLKVDHVPSPSVCPPNRPPA